MIFNRGIDIMKIIALSNHKPGILSNYIRISDYIYYSKCLIKRNYTINKLERHLDNEIVIVIKYVIFSFNMSYKIGNL